MLVNLKKQFRFAHQGINVKTYEPGEQDMPDDAAEHAVEAKLAVRVPGKKEKAVKPTSNK